MGQEDRIAALEAALRESETRRRLVEDQVQATWKTDAHGVVVADSPSWRAYTGQTLEEWLGYGWLDAVHPDDRAYAERQWRDAVAVRRVVNAEFRLRTPDGGWRWTNVRAAPVPGDDGGIVHWAGMNIDIDARRRAEEVLRESEDKFRTLFESIDDGMAVVEMIYDAGDITDIVFRQVNEAYKHHSGLTGVIGRSVGEVLPGVEDIWLDRYERVARTGEPIRVEDYQRDVDRWFDVRFSRIDELGRFVAIVFTDITNRKQAEFALRDSDERQGFLLALGDLLQRLDQPNALKAAAMQLLGRHLGVSRAQYHEVDASGDYYGADGVGYSNGLPLLDLKYRIDQFGSFVGNDFVAGRAFRSDDLSADPRPTRDEREAFEKYEIRAGAGFPLLRGGKLVAFVAVHDRHPHAWTDLEMELIRETAERVWVAVEKVRGDIAARESVERQRFLLAFSDALRGELGTDAIAERAIRMLAEQLRLDRCYLAHYRLDEDRADITHQAVSGRLPPMPEAIRLSDFPAAFRTVFDQTLVIADVVADESLSPTDRDNILALGMRALMAPTLRRGPQRPLWVVVAASAGPRHWMPGEIALAEEVAERTWEAVERARVEAALRDSDERFRQFAQASASGLWIRDAGTLDMEYVSPAITAIYGVEADTLLGDVARWGSHIVPDDRAAALRHLDEARQGRSVVHEFRIQRPSDGAFRWIRNTDFPLSGNGQVMRIGGIAEDVTDVRLAVEHQGVLLAELQHRVRNIMAIIRSIVARTAERAGSVDDYATLLSGRLLALARVQALLTRAANVRVAVAAIVRDEVSVQAQHEGQYELVGPDVALSPKAAEVLTLAIHELATNALKYGALSAAHGRVTVRWDTVERSGGPWLVFDWSEEGAPERPPPAADAPRRIGFGSELIEGRVPYELKGTGSLSIEPGGAHCHLEFPLRETPSVLETGAPQQTIVYGGALDMTGEADLGGRAILVVEDDYYIATDTARALKGAGARVLGPCASEEQALGELEDEAPSAAVVDINLGPGPSFGLARRLAERGVPFVFVTGYDEEVIPPEFDAVPRLQKPVDLRRIVAAVAGMVGAAA